jgi:hypothetical protein
MNISHTAIQATERAAPTCGKCGRRVDRFDERHDTFTGKVIFVAYCHGETERVEFNDYELLRSPDFSIAFRQTPRLSP